MLLPKSPTRAIHARIPSLPSIPAPQIVFPDWERKNLLQRVPPPQSGSRRTSLPTAVAMTSEVAKGARRRVLLFPLPPETRNARQRFRGPDRLGTGC